MHLPFILSLLSAVSFASAQDTNLATVRRAFNNANRSRKHQIPENISLKFNPKVLLEVTFPQQSGRSITLHAGVQLPRNATAGPPTFQVVGQAGRGPFVVAAVDPDAPTPQTPTSAQIRHFLGGNFVLEPSTLLRNTTPAISNFLQPTPPAGSDPHRYVFLLFEQPQGFNAETLVTSTTSIALFNISQFAGAVGLGQPIGGTFMLVGPDPST
ncbi:phosphatidylethanolamine-binding protein [Crassisporium funariophilum]|nr:phosphatidylethanolamine-binding protein [Crassisporium funariophilum]